jgi:hypothetical protein
MTTELQSLIPESDLDFLREKQLAFEVEQSGGEIYIVVRNYQLPSAYRPSLCDLMIKLPAGYPNANPDMFWTTPGVRLANGSAPVAAEVQELYNNRAWQRWSRHTSAWRAGIDNLRTKLRSVRTELEKGR